MVRVTQKVFDDILQEVIASLPEEFAEVLEQVPVIVEPWPSPALRRTTADADELLGLFIGPTVAEWGATEGPPETSRIHIFQRPLEAACGTRAELAEQIRITLLHELGHCLGFDEDGVGRLGLE